jgi:hypothetical protein
MRSRYAVQQFGLVFGAGASLQLGFPFWKDLLDRIAKNCTSLNSASIPSQPSLAQCLFQAFLNKYMEDNGIHLQPSLEQSAELKSKWTKLVIDALYNDVPEESFNLKLKDKYLKNFIPIIKKLKLTVNYNFDDSLQRLLNEFRDPEEKESGRRYRTDWRIDPQVLPHHAVIYHPNGYLPKFTGEKPSDSIVLLDDAFGDQLIESMAGKYTYLINHYAQNTCLFIGLSLEDPTLQNILRRNAITHPGHVHYHVRYMRNGEKLSDPEKNTIASANFETYNLVTLFLNDDEIALLADLIAMKDDKFSDLCDQSGARHKYVYYITGCVAAGKSTSISYFRSLSIHDEWIESMPEDMNKDPSLASLSNIDKIDNFVATQWRKKNRVLLDSKGIIVVDRCQLDAFGFTEPEKWQDKASFLYNNLFPGESKDTLQNGMVIFLTNSPGELSARALSGLRETNKGLLEKQQNLLSICYAPQHGIYHLNCENKMRTEVAKLISKIIYTRQYIEFDLHAYLKTIKDMGGPND